MTAEVIIKKSQNVVLCPGRKVPGMGWLRNLHQTISYKLGYRRGRHGMPFKCPWWVDSIVFALADMDGYKATYLAAGGKPRK
jgi:hypothetical protein